MKLTPVTPTVLVLEVDPASCRLLRVLLQGTRYRLLWAANGTEVLRLSVEEHPDVILLDLDLPDGDGMSVLTALQEWSSAAVMAMTFEASAAARIKALDAGADECLVKPFDGAELLARLRVLLRRERGFAADAAFSDGKIYVNLATRSVAYLGCDIEFTPIEAGVASVVDDYITRFGS